jgi:nitric oxide synthase-interacting protein
VDFSGHIYSREAIVSYLLSQTQKLKAMQESYQNNLKSQQSKELQKDIQSQQDTNASFLQSQSGGAYAPQLSTLVHSTHRISSVSRAIAIPESSKDQKDGKDSLKRSSYWLSEAQPQYDEGGPAKPPPQRPASPMSGRPLKRKDLIPITLGKSAEDATKVVCAASGKSISTQRVVLISSTGVVLLRDVFEQLTKEDKRCPVTGKKFKPKHVIELKKGSSGFAASGETVAKKYRPTLT